MSNAGPQEVAYAGLGQRALAAFLDNLVWLFLLGLIAANIPASVYEDEPVVIGVIFLALFSAWFNYFWLTEWKWGKTIGKAIVSIHVTTEDGGRPGFGPATIRNVLRLVDMLVIGPILIVRSKRRQRLGDRAAHTIVVRDRPAPVPATANPHAPPPPAKPPMGALPPHAPPPPGPPPPGPPPPGPPPPAHKEGPWSRRGIGISTGGWTPAHVVWGVVAVIGLLIVETAIVAAFDPELDSLGSTLAVQALLAATLVGVALTFASLRGSPLTALRRLGLRGFPASALGLAAVAYLAYIFFAAIYAALVQPQQDDITRDLGLDEGGLAAIAAGVLIVAAAPFSEEIFFRGFMYGGLRARLPMWGAALISGAVFGLLHYTDPDSIGVVPQLAVLGVVLAWLYERTGSLWPPILLHVVNNGIALAIVTST